MSIDREQSLLILHRLGLMGSWILDLLVEVLCDLLMSKQLGTLGLVGVNRLDWLGWPQ